MSPKAKSEVASFHELLVLLRRHTESPQLDNHELSLFDVNDKLVHSDIAVCASTRDSAHANQAKDPSIMAPARKINDRSVTHWLSRLRRSLG